MRIVCRNVRRSRDRYRLLLLVVIAFNLLLLVANYKAAQSDIDDESICTGILDDEGRETIMAAIDKEQGVDEKVKKAYVDLVRQRLKDCESGVLVFLMHQFKKLLGMSKVVGLREVEAMNDLLRSPTKNQTQIDLFLSQPIINRHDYPYVYQHPDGCSGDRLKFIIAIPSAPGNFENRKKVREHGTGDFVKDPKNRARMFFFLGKLAGKLEKDRAVQKRIDAEEKQYGDIIQSTFIDTYRNITKKASLILKWSRTFCGKNTFILRTDDDLRVNLTKMSSAMLEAEKNNASGRAIFGNVRRNYNPIRTRTSKYYTRRDDYPYDKLPDFILGGSMGYSAATADLLFKAYQREKVFWLDDVFITAICASKVGVAIRDSATFEFDHWEW